MPFKADRHLVVVMVPMCYAPLTRKVGEMEGLYGNMLRADFYSKASFQGTKAELEAEWKTPERCTSPLEACDLY